MIKLPENSTRKKLRLTQCVLYLLELLFCSMPFIQGVATDGYLYSYSVFEIVTFIGGEFPNTANGAAFQSYVPFYLIFIIVPIIGFLASSFDNERNIKNIVSIFCSLAGVVSILTIVSYTLSLGSLLALITYVVICFITSFAMIARVVKD